MIRFTGKSKSLASLIFLLPMFASSQARLVINNNAFIVIDNGAELVVQNPATNAITTSGTGGNIVTESEFDQVRWMIGTNTGTYTVPLSTSAATKIPFTITITTGGLGAGNILFSTYAGGNFDNNTYRPSDVTHTNDLATGSVNNSAEVIDRFWIIDANGYTTRPVATLSFTYIDAEHSAAGNAISESSLGAQRFNSGLGIWGDYLPQGTVNTATNVVSGVPAASSNFFRSWTLVDNASPLPIELLSWEGACENENVLLKWTTQSETNNDFFTIEKSNNGVHYTFLAQIEGAQNSNSIINYSYTDLNANGTFYYRLSQTDFNGSVKIYPPLVSGCWKHAFDFIPFTNGDEQNILLQLSSGITTQFTGEVCDIAGKLLLRTPVYVNEGNSVLMLNTGLISTGVYLVRLYNDKESYTKKIMVR